MLDTVLGVLVLGAGAYIVIALLVEVVRGGRDER